MICGAGFSDVAWGVAVALEYAGSCSSNSTPSLGTSTCLGCSPKEKKKAFKNWIYNIHLISTFFFLKIDI